MRSKSNKKNVFCFLFPNAMNILQYQLLGSIIYQDAACCYYRFIIYYTTQAAQQNTSIRNP